MIERPKVGQTVAYVLRNGCVNHATIDEIDDEFVRMTAQGSPVCRMFSDIFDLNDHDGIVDYLGDMITTINMTIAITHEKQAAGKPIFVITEKTRL